MAKRKQRRPEAGLYTQSHSFPGSVNIVGYASDGAIVFEARVSGDLYAAMEARGVWGRVEDVVRAFTRPPTRKPFVWIERRASSATTGLTPPEELE